MSQSAEWLTASVNHQSHYNDRLCNAPDPLCSPIHRSRHPCTAMPTPQATLRASVRAANSMKGSS
eukprot:6197923-Pleurochrysis_carterae.AAC.1